MTRFWLGLELRRRRRPLIALALLVALAVAVVLSSVAGARRGASAERRLEAATRAATVLVRPMQSDAAYWATVRRLPEVEAVAEFPAMAFGVDDVHDGRAGLTVAPADPDLFRTVEVPVLLAGRLPDPNRVDEVVITPGFGPKHVGDTVTIRLVDPVQAAATNRPGSREAPRGPRITATVVGIVRSAWFADQAGRRGGVIASPAMFAHYRADVIGDQDQIPIEAFVRLKHGDADVPAFTTDLTAATRADGNVQILDATVGAHRRQVDGYEAAVLLAFAGAAALAAIVLVGQVVVRQATVAAGELRVLRASGLSRGRLATTAALGPALAGAAGSVLGVAVAVLASAWMPIGSAALHEPRPGIEVDTEVLIPGALLATGLVTLGAAGTAFLIARPTAHAGTAVRSTTVRLAARLGLAVSVVVGARFALEARRGITAVRPAMVGAGIGVLGIVAAFTFSAGVTDAAGTPSRFGQSQQLEIYVGFGGDDGVPDARRTLTAVARDPAVAAVNDARLQTVMVDGRSFELMAHDPVGGRPLPTVMLRGRSPRAADEIALGTSTAAALHVRPGDRITVGAARLTVSGVGLLPAALENTYTEGAWVTADGYRRAVGDPATAWFWHIAQISLVPGADPAAAAGRLQRIVDSDQLTVTSPVLPPPEIEEVRDVAVLPLVLGGFLAVLAVGAVGGTVFGAVRHRRGELALLRALGMTPKQAAVTILAQATVLAVVGLLAGVPLGLAVGRAAWRLVAEETPLQYLAPSPVAVLTVIGPATVIVCAVLAAVPSRAAARLSIARVLRSE